MGGNATKLKTRKNSSNRHQRSALCGRNKSVKEKIPPITANSNDLSTTNVEALVRPVTPLQLKNQMNRTSKAMLHILEPLMDNEVAMINDLKQFEDVKSNKQRHVFLFTSSEYVDLLGKIPDVIEKVFVLGTSSNPTHKTFKNIQDLIFQIAEELAQLYEEEAHQFEKLGEFVLAQSKRQVISEMYRQLMDVPTEDLTLYASICTDTLLIWLTRNRNASDEEKLTQISPSLIVFDIEQTCWDYVIQYGNETALFLIIDSNFNSPIVSRLDELAQVKYLYRTNEFIDVDKLCFRLTHDLIKHYRQLGDQLTAERRNQEARQMFLRAQQLCQILFS